MRKERREKRTAELIRQDAEAEKQMETAAIERSMQFKNNVKGKYSIWRREYDNQNSDYTLKLMQDQVIMAKVYGSIAWSKNDAELYETLMTRVKENQRVLGEANSDAELDQRYLLKFILLVNLTQGIIQSYFTIMNSIMLCYLVQAGSTIW